MAAPLKLVSGELYLIVVRAVSLSKRITERESLNCITGPLLPVRFLFTVNLHIVMLIPSLDMSEHAMLLLLDSQMSTGGAALMAVRVLVDYGVPEDRIVFVTYMAGRVGVNRLLSVFPEMRVVMCRMGDDMESRWVEARYLGC